MEKPLSLESPLFCFEKDVAGEQIHTVATGEAVVYLKSGPGRDNKSEDSAALIPVDKHSGVLVVADGVGGHRSGDLASRSAIEAVHRSIKKEIKLGNELRKAILDGFEEANRAVMKIGGGAATTLSIVEIRERTVRSYHAGDSLILWVGSKGKLKYYTVPHSPVGYAVEAGYLEEEEALLHEERHLVSNVIGTSEMKIEIGPELELDTQDTVLLATDGLSDNLSTEEIVEFIRKGSLEDTVREMAALGKKRMIDPEEGKPSKPDDMTFVLFRLGK